MLKERDELDTKIRNFFQKYYADKEITNVIKEEMLKKGYNLGEITRIINLNSPIEGMSEDDIGVLSKAITIADSNFDYKKYWNDRELENIEKYMKPKQVKESTMVFQNIIEGNPSENGEIEYYICPKYSIEELQEVFQTNHLLAYDPKLQRDLVKTKTKKGEVNAKITRSNRKIASITNRILKNEMHPSSLVFYVRNKNAFIDKYKNIKIDKIKHAMEITVNEETEVLEIDGYSRTIATMRAIGLNETLKKPLNTFYMVIICLFNDEKAGDFIKQINEQTPFDFDEIEVIGSKDNPYMNFTKSLNDTMNEINNVLYHKFAKTQNDIEIDKTKLYLYTTFAKAVEYNFFKNKELEPKQLVDLLRYIVDGFNEILYDLDQLNKDKLIYLSPNSCIGYIALLSKLKDDKDWQKNIYHLLENLDLTNEDELKKINFYTKLIKQPIIKKISEFFIERSE